jgi:hypothetical protein
MAECARETPQSWGSRSDVIIVPHKEGMIVNINMELAWLAAGDLRFSPMAGALKDLRIATQNHTDDVIQNNYATRK